MSRDDTEMLKGSHLRKLRHTVNLTAAELKT